MKKYLSFILLLLLPIMASSQRFRQERYKNFEESNDAWTNSFNQIDIKNSKFLDTQQKS